MGPARLELATRPMVVGYLNEKWGNLLAVKHSKAFPNLLLIRQDERQHLRFSPPALDQSCLYFSSVVTGNLCYVPDQDVVGRTCVFPQAINQLVSCNCASPRGYGHNAIISVPSVVNGEQHFLHNIFNIYVGSIDAGELVSDTGA